MTSPPTMRFRSMGSSCDVTVVGGPSSLLAEVAQRRAVELEQRWSRFIETSEICALNMSDGRSVRVSSDTLLLVDHAVAAWRWTTGRFDPTVLQRMVALGYDRSFELVRPGRAASPGADGPVPGCRGISIDHASSRVTLPRGVGLDPGGIGKGLAADLIVEALLDAGARGACVSMGGDVRASGEAPDRGWRVGIANPFIDGDLVAMVLLSDHGLATSNRLIRRWVDGAGVEHNHLVDPSSGGSVGGLVAASVISGQAWWSEVLAKVAMVDQAATRSLIPLLKGEGLYVDRNGEVEVSTGFGRFDERSVLPPSVPAPVP